MHRSLARRYDNPDDRAEPYLAAATTIRQVPVLASVPARVQPLAVTARVIMLVLVAALTLIAPQDPAQLRWIALLVVAALPAFLAPEHRVLAPMGRFAEVAIVGLAAGSTRLGFGTAAPGVWVAPGNLAAETRRTLERRGLAGYVDIFAGDYLAFGDLRAKIREWWDLDELTDLYADFLGRHRPLLDRVDGGGTTPLE